MNQKSQYHHRYSGRLAAVCSRTTTRDDVQVSPRKSTKGFLSARAMRGDRR
ncbi:hypothetical protein KCP70_03795 [Salmonella enterica subsp. enterica]|nr:hypothetical protein KCP70_03795 [Salmonella enterica subsp. enterica]